MSKINQSECTQHNQSQRQLEQLSLRHHAIPIVIILLKHQLQRLLHLTIHSLVVSHHLLKCQHTILIRVHGLQSLLSHFLGLLNLLGCRLHQIDICPSHRLLLRTHIIVSNGRTLTLILFGSLGHLLVVTLTGLAVFWWRNRSALILVIEFSTLHAKVFNFN